MEIDRCIVAVWICCTAMLDVAIGNVCSSLFTSAYECETNRTLHDSRGLIRSSMYPVPTVPAMCEQYNIVAFAGQITISFIDFDVSPHDVPCNETYVAIGPEPCVVWCGDHFPRVYTSARHYVTITYVYRESGAALRRGFVFRYVADNHQAGDSCHSEEFTCDNDRCIPQQWHCNGADECGDGSDERMCHSFVAPYVPPNGYACGKNNFGCIDGVSGVYRCFHDHHKCDGVEHCVNGSDEQMCDMATRPCQQWSGDYTGWLASSSVTSHCSAPGCHGCTSILYVPTHEPVQLRFNTFQLSSSEYVEIRDGATSAGLLIGRFTSTHRPGRVVEVAGNKIFIVFSSDTFHSFRRAFNLTFQPKGTCLEDQVHCSVERDCYPATTRCDGFWDCPLHGSDEFSCPHCRSKFTCGRNSRRCYMSHQRCDGVNNCVHKTDELHCSAVICGSHNGTFLCGSGQCIRESSWCDSVHDCRDGSDEVSCPVSNKVILSAVVGSLSCALLLVIALGVTYRFVRLPPGHRSSRHISPITAIEEQIYAQQSAPPPYLEAMATSRPFDECQRETVGCLNDTAATPGTESGQVSDDAGDTAALLCHSANGSDDDLLDVGVDEAPVDRGNGDENIVIALGCLARWHRHAKLSAGDSESSVSAIDSSPLDVCDAPVVEAVDAADSLSAVCDPPDSETSTTDVANTDDSQLLIC